MRTANHTIVSYVLYLIGSTASLRALKGINRYFSALIRLTKTKFPTLVTSNTDESHGLGAFVIVEYYALSVISLPYALKSKIFLCQNVGNYFRHKCTKFHEKSTTG